MDTKSTDNQEDSETPEKNVGGHPPHVPTLLTRAKVEGFTCAGFNQTQIATYLKISEKTLRKHYADELDQSKMDKALLLANNLYADALKGDKDDRQFWLKCQARWAPARAMEEQKTTTETLLEKLIEKL